MRKWSTLFPALGAAYRAKESFHDIYSHRSKEDAQKAAQEWLRSVDDDVAWAFRETIGALQSWWTEIFNYYDYPVSNAYTESINNIAKGMNRMGRGYSFDVICARLLFDADARKDTRTTVRKKVRKAVEQPVREFFSTFTTNRSLPVTTTYETVHEEVMVEYGPYLPTLARKLEAGEFT